MPFGQAALSRAGRSSARWSRQASKPSSSLDVAALVRSARDADRPRPLELGNLADQRAHGAGGGRHHHGLARLRTPDVEQTGVGRHPRHAEHAERRRDRRERRIDLAQALAVRHRMGLPAVRTEYDVTHGNAVEIRRYHLAYRAAFHHLPDRDRLGVGRRIAHAPAHVGIEREPQRAQQHFACARRGDRHRARCGNRSRSARRPAAPRARSACAASMLTPGSDSSGSRG